MPQEDAALAVDHIHHLEHRTAVVAHVDGWAPTVGDLSLSQIHAALLQPNDGVLPAVLQLAPLKEGLAVARCNECMLPTSNDSLPEGRAGSISLLQAAVARLQAVNKEAQNSQHSMPQ